MISFKQSDLDELRNSCNYLSDVIIDFYFKYLSSIYPSDSILFVPTTISFLLANFEDEKDIADCVKPLEFHSKDLIFFPVNNGGIHWSLLVYCRESNVFAHHDSLSGLNNSEAKELYEAVKGCVLETDSFRYRTGFRNKRKHMDGPSNEPFYAKPPSPRQKNGYDCGLYVMAMAKAICGWFCSGVREQTWLREIEKLDDSVGITMRPHVLELIREASEGRLGSVLCTIEEERRVNGSEHDDNIGRLSDVEIELQQIWANFDEPSDSKTTSSPSTSTAVGKIVANDSPPASMEEESDNGKILLIKEEAVDGSEMVERILTCETTLVPSSMVEENEPVEEIEEVNVNSGLETEDIENDFGTTSSLSDSRASALDGKDLTQRPPEERSSTVEVQRGSHSLFWEMLGKR